MKSIIRFAAIAAFIVGAQLGCVSSVPAPGTIEARTKADPGILQAKGRLFGQLPFFNVPLALSPDKPAAVKKAPQANGTLLYGTIPLGEGGAGGMIVALDREPEGADAEQMRKLYVDANRNGDLTDDGENSWTQFVARGGSFKASVAGRTVSLPYAGGGSEDYGLYFIYAVPSADGEPQLSYRRGGGRTGSIDVAGKKMDFVLIENNSRGTFNDPDAKSPLWLMLDVNSDGAFGTEERYDARRTLIIGDTVYEVRPNASGSTVSFVPSTRAPQIPNAPRPAATAQRPAAPRKPLLEVGTTAPDFTVEKAGGAKMKLSDLRGQVVVLDFWATWCGPCKASMPSLEELHTKTKEQNVAIFGVCVWDSREAFDKWMVEPQVKTTYLKAFDPAGVNRDNGNADSIAKKFYNVSGIPTFYVIDREGKIAASFVGSGAASKQGLHDALVKLGVKL